MGLPLVQEGQRISEERHWLPPKASGEEKVDKNKAAEWKCQREGRGGWGPASERAGQEQNGVGGTG